MPRNLYRSFENKIQDILRSQNTRSFEKSKYKIIWEVKTQDLSRSQSTRSFEKSKYKMFWELSRNLSRYFENLILFKIQDLRSFENPRWSLETFTDIIFHFNIRVLLKNQY